LQSTLTPIRPERGGKTQAKNGVPKWTEKKKRPLFLRKMLGEDGRRDLRRAQTHMGQKKYPPPKCKGMLVGFGRGGRGGGAWKRDVVWGRADKIVRRKAEEVKLEGGFENCPKRRQELTRKKRGCL